MTLESFVISVTHDTKRGGAVDHVIPPIIAHVIALSKVDKEHASKGILAKESQRAFGKMPEKCIWETLKMHLGNIENLKAILEILLCR